ncbi:hypothetical protein LTR91_006392 [Friedmanniomyces endolithicus]|uniref:Fibronectin type-III domain-containing protein n=1 Tax=Friedmanniomyces endolithicus TaxID=329885 RepID=A0AAN6JCF7_9PEZI|nr:hypothetical protein LTR35_002145 [Friedmanniomyces endolithicus]KAK0299811.1 hypothetical protein LTS00_001581 [Friedmanniomyces endolithicus]KAK0319289.1 hypothetical protein LTR82_009706 [Friedmanniomyces endolithicus]KAK0909874.1 hypothetical protein LTR57_016136 [Friedmanniomyces endolithicus]KAK0998252.1 hypothetical protein LTR91_006392 [Friedmanniomyces endolithicus]
MKLFWAYSCLLATTLSTLGLAATILIDPIPSTVNVNDVVVVTWSLDQHYALEFDLVLQGQGSVAWTLVNTISHLEGAPGNASYEWRVPSVAPSGSYALWLYGQNIPNNGSGYANLTNWFKIEGGHANASIGSGQSLSFAQIAGVVVGITMAVSLIAAAAFVFQRRSLQKPPRVCLVETPSRKSFSSITDEKAAARLAMSQVDV